MCMRNTEEGCALSSQLAKQADKVANIDERLTKVETDVGKIRSEAQDGFRQGAEAMRNINTSLSNLAHDFGSRMNNMEARIITEKEKWGEVLRTILKWGAKALIYGALVAMGVNVVSSVIKSVFARGG